MKNIENGIQLKIDTLILGSNQNNNDKRQEEKYNEITSLISYIHCLDLFDFLENYSKVQKNELLFHISLIYNILGYYKLSLDYINESLVLIPNVPTIILFKSCLYVSMNKLDDTQKCLFKYKYLIGEDNFGNYIYNIVRIIYYYLLDYEENIILREINIIETKNQNHDYNITILYFIKSKLLNKLSEKFKQIDIKRSNKYKNDSILNKEKAFNTKKLDADYLFKHDINKENLLKLLMLIYPNFVEYKPKPLIDYNNNFHCGFKLFYILFKICKIFKLKILLIKYKKIHNQNFQNLNSNFSPNNNSLEKILHAIENDTKIFENANNLNCNIKECKNIILTLSKNIFLQNYINNKNRIKEENIYNKLNEININNKLKTNYYINNDFYSNINLNRYIINNINRNKDYKETKLYKDFFFDEAIENNHNIKKGQIKDDSKLQLNHCTLEEKEENIFKNKLFKNINNKRNKNLIISTQSKYDKNKNSKDKMIRTNITLEKMSSKETNQHTKAIDKDNIQKKKYYITGSYKNLINNNVLRVNKKNNEKKNNCNTNDNNKNKLKENKKPLYKDIKTENNSFKNVNIFGTIRIFANKNISKHSNTNGKTKNNKKKENEINNNNLFKDKDSYIEHDVENKTRKNNYNDKNNNYNNKNKVNMNYNYKSFISKINKLNNIDYGRETHIKKTNSKQTIYYTLNNNNIVNKDSNDTINLKTNYEQANQIIKLDNNFLKNQEKKNFIKTSKNKNLKKKTSKKNSLKNLTIKLESIKNKNDLNFERSEPNTLRENRNDNKYISLNNCFIDSKYIKSNNNNSHNKIKTFLELKPIEKSQKIDNIRRIERKIINNLSINFDFLPKTKIDIPIYQKSTVFNTLKVDSKEKIKINIKTNLRFNSSKKKINYKNQIKKRLNYQCSKPSLNKFKNYDLNNGIYYFNNIINKNKNNKNTVSVRIKNNSTNK